MLFVAAVLFVVMHGTHKPVLQSQKRATKLIPLSPYERTFSSKRYGKVGIAYFFVTKRGDWHDSAYRKKLLKSVRQKAGKRPENYDLYSLYIYEKTEKLNKSFHGNADELHGIYDAHLVAFVRWHHAKPDLFYLLLDGNVVYDIVEDIALSWEFD